MRRELLRRKYELLAGMRVCVTPTCQRVGAAVSCSGGVVCNPGLHIYT
jgi:hypothetical protein